MTEDKRFSMKNRNLALFLLYYPVSWYLYDPETLTCTITKIFPVSYHRHMQQYECSTFEKLFFSELTHWQQSAILVQECPPHITTKCSCMIWTGLSLLIDNVQSVKTAASFSNWPLTWKVCFSCLPSDVSHIPELSRCFLHYAAVPVGNKNQTWESWETEILHFSLISKVPFQGLLVNEQKIANSKQGKY